jgi:hypothetical protein
VTPIILITLSIPVWLVVTHFSEKRRIRELKEALVREMEVNKRV